MTQHTQNSQREDAVLGGDGEKKKTPAGGLKMKLFYLYREKAGVLNYHLCYTVMLYKDDQDQLILAV